MTGASTAVGAPAGTAVVTGLGVLAPNGLGTEAYWSATLSGRSGIGPITEYDGSGYPCRFVGDVLDFDPREHVPSRLMPQTDPLTRFAVAASDWAVADAGIVPGSLDDLGMGVVTANASGGFYFTQREIQNLWTKGPHHVSAYQSFAWFYAVNTGQISIRHGMRGPGDVLVADQAAGLDAVGHARRQIRRGTPLMVTGGMEAPLNPYAMVAQISHGKLSRARVAERAYMPFSPDADGFVPAEGGAILVTEDAASARERGAPRCYGEIAGYAATFDPLPQTGRPPALRRAAELAIADAGLTPDGIDVVFADAAGTPEADRVEADTIAALFGPEGVPVTAPKTMTGRMLAGGPPVDVAAALLAIRDQVIPPTVNVPELHPDWRLDLVRDRPREARLATALILARGHGGFNSALVVRAAEL
ncbi:ketosynthase chain-length factor [Streptomycetaceae bacterium NBC_01309]